LYLLKLLLALFKLVTRLELQDEISLSLRLQGGV
jgi:hypothetical protein